MESSHEITKAVPLGKSRSSLRLNSRPKRRCSRTTEPDRKEMRIIDDEAMDEIMEFVKKNRGSSITKEEKLDVLLLQASFRHEHFMKQKKLSPGRRTNKVGATERVAQYLCHGKEQVGKVWSDYVKDRVVQVADPGGNSRRKSTRVPMAHGVIVAVQKFVRERRITRTRTVAKDVMQFLNQKGYITVNDGSRKDEESALRSVQRFLERTGYKRGKKKGMKSYRLQEENVRKRDAYVQRMTEVNKDPSRRVVYMDESYIHKNYHRHDDSLFDPNDEQDLETKAHHKGQRYCFIAAIIDDDRSAEVRAIPENERPDLFNAGLMMDTLDIFQGGSKQTADYHGMFNSEYFIKWMRKLLDALSERGVKNALIVMDNAKYHKMLPEGTPKGQWKKQLMLEYCASHGIQYSPNEMKSQLWGRLKKHIQDNIKPVIVMMAEEEGHEVLFSPPHHSDLQPIELVWANVKGAVGRQYTTETTFKDVLCRLKVAFNELKAESVRGCIRKANKHLEELLQHVIQLEAMEDEEGDKGDRGEDSGNDSSEDYLC